MAVRSSPFFLEASSLRPQFLRILTRSPGHADATGRINIAGRRGRVLKATLMENWIFP